MTTNYELVCGYTKFGVATSPSSAPTITVVDSANNILVAALTATTAVTNMAGLYRYSYSGADGLIVYGLFHTSDLTMDQQDIFVTALINPAVMDIQSRLPAALTADGNIKADALKISGAAPSGLVANLDVAVSTRQTLGAGSTSTPITVTDGTNPVANADVWASTSSTGNNVVARGYTNAFGIVTFMLDPGTYYIWISLPGYDFAPLPKTQVVT